MMSRIPVSAWLTCVSLKQLTYNASTTILISYKIGPSLGIITIYIQRLLPRTTMLFSSIQDQKIARVFLVTASTWVLIRKDLETRLVHLLQLQMPPFTGVSYDTNVIWPFTTLVNILYLITVGLSHNPSSWVIPLFRPPHFRKTWSILMVSFSTLVPP